MSTRKVVARTWVGGEEYRVLGHVWSDGALELVGAEQVRTRRQIDTSWGYNFFAFRHWDLVETLSLAPGQQFVLEGGAKNRGEA